MVQSLRGEVAKVQTATPCDLLSDFEYQEKGF
jgi:hypothetical protein